MATVKNTSAAPQKYSNHAQLVQGVSQCADHTLSQGERLFLLTLAAFTLRDRPHPGNKKLAAGCGITSRQGVNYIAAKLRAKGLIRTPMGTKGGKALAVEYEICTDDPRFPAPKQKSKPASPDLHVSDAKPATPDLQVSKQQTRKYADPNPQVDPSIPASSDLHPNTRTNGESTKDILSPYGNPNSPFRHFSNDAFQNSPEMPPQNLREKTVKPAMQKRLDLDMISTLERRLRENPNIIPSERQKIHDSIARLRAKHFRLSDF